MESKNNLYKLAALVIATLAVIFSYAELKKGEFC